MVGRELVAELFFVDLIEDVFIADIGIAGIAHFSDIIVDDLKNIVYLAFFGKVGNVILIDTLGVVGYQNGFVFGKLMPENARIEPCYLGILQIIEFVGKVGKGKAGYR